MGRFGGVTFSLVFSSLGWIFAPFDTEPTAAFVVASVMSIGGLGSCVYFALYGDRT